MSSRGAPGSKEFGIVGKQKNGAIAQSVNDHGHHQGFFHLISCGKKNAPDDLGNGKSLPRRVDEGEKSGGKDKSREEAPAAEVSEEDPAEEKLFRHGADECPDGQENRQKRKRRGVGEGQKIDEASSGKENERRDGQNDKPESGGPQEAPSRVAKKRLPADAHGSSQTPLASQKVKKGNRFQEAKDPHRGKGRRLQGAKKKSPRRFQDHDGGQGEKHRFSRYPD